jgi:hypothetical protein
VQLSKAWFGAGPVEILERPWSRAYVADEGGKGITFTNPNYIR